MGMVGLMGYVTKYDHIIIPLGCMLLSVYVTMLFILRSPLQWFGDWYGLQIVFHVTVLITILLCLVVVALTSIIDHLKDVNE